MINIANILRSYPKNTELYCTVYGKCRLVEIEKGGTIHLISIGMSGMAFKCDKHGRLNYFGECVLFPSEKMRIWFKFAFQKGDFLTNGRYRCLFHSWVPGSDYTKFKGMYVSGSYIDKVLDTKDFIKENDPDLLDKYVDDIERCLGGKLNTMTLRLEKPTKKPDFKDGDFAYAKVRGGNSVIFIFEKYITEFNKECIRDHISVWNNGAVYTNEAYTLSTLKNITELRKATADEIKKLMDAISAHGFEWDADKKKVVETMEHQLFKFEDGDILSGEVKMPNADKIHNVIFIFKDVVNHCVQSYISLFEDNTMFDMNISTLCGTKCLHSCRKATENEVERLNKELLNRDRRWNANKYEVEYIGLDKFKDGDILHIYIRKPASTELRSAIFIYNEKLTDDKYVGRYVSLFEDDDLYTCYNSTRSALVAKSLILGVEKATDEDKKKLFDLLKKRFHKVWSAELKKLVDLNETCDFKPKDWCLMRITNNGIWTLCQFSHISTLGYVAVGGRYFDRCIPYNNETKHLLGTNEDWKGGIHDD